MHIAVVVDGYGTTEGVVTLTSIDMGKAVETLAAFMLGRLGRVPGTGAGFRRGNARFEVVDMDGNRIDKVLIQVDREGSET